VSEYQDYPIESKKNKIMKDNPQPTLKDETEKNKKRPRKIKIKQ
jgi:hypothetical protein